MKNFMIVAVALLSCTAFVFAQGTTKKLAEPKCCKGMKCKHAMGEDKHHKCNKFCHSKMQKKGECCKGYNTPKPAAKPKAPTTKKKVG